MDAFQNKGIFSCIGDKHDLLYRNISTMVNRKCKHW
jgi:hypothetical protein